MNKAYPILQELADLDLVAEVETIFFRRLTQINLIDDERAHAPQWERCELELLALNLQQRDVPTTSMVRLGKCAALCASTYFSMASPSAREVATEEPGWVMK